MYEYILILCMYECVYLHKYICMSVCICINIYTNIYIYLYLYIYQYMYTCIYMYPGLYIFRRNWKSLQKDLTNLADSVTHRAYVRSCHDDVSAHLTYAHVTTRDQDMCFVCLHAHAAFSIICCTWSCGDVCWRCWC